MNGKACRHFPLKIGEPVEKILAVMASNLDKVDFVERWIERANPIDNLEEVVEIDDILLAHLYEVRM